MADRSLTGCEEKGSPAVDAHARSLVIENLLAFLELVFNIDDCGAEEMAQKFRLLSVPIEGLSSPSSHLTSGGSQPPAPLVPWTQCHRPPKQLYLCGTYKFTYIYISKNN